jgi:hypothetical protein
MYVAALPMSIIDPGSIIVAAGQVRGNLRQGIEPIALVNDGRSRAVSLEVENDFFLALIAKDRHTLSAGLRLIGSDKVIRSSRGKNLGIHAGMFNPPVFNKANTSGSGKAFSDFKSSSSVFFAPHKLLGSTPITGRDGLRSQINKTGTVSKGDVQKAFKRGKLLDRFYLVIIGEADQYEGWQGPVYLHQSSVQYNVLPALIKGQMTPGGLLSQTTDAMLDELMLDLG